MKFQVQILNLKKGVLGFSYEMHTFIEGISDNKKPILVDYLVYTIGLYFINFEFTFRMKNTMREGDL